MQEGPNLLSLGGLEDKQGPAGTGQRAGGESCAGRDVLAQQPDSGGALRWGKGASS